MTVSFNTFKFWNQSILSLNLVSIAVVGFAEVASAKTFRLLVQTGQTLPQNAEPIEQLFEPTIGRDRQIAVIIQHRGKQSGQIFDQFIGLNSISPSNQIQLVDQNTTTSNGLSARIGSFSAPSISEGKIAYITQSRISSRGNPGIPKVEFKVGARTITNFGEINRNYPSNESVVSFVNGRAFLLDAGPISSGSNDRLSSVERIDTRSNPPNQSVLITDATNRAIRTSADNLVLSKLDTSSGSNIYKLFEKPIDSGSFKEIVPLGNNPASCGFAASFKNLVVCASQGSVLSVRLGQNAPFKAIPLPSGVTQVANPSMSNARVMFQAKASKEGRSVDTIYLSNDGKAPTVLIQAGEKINNKTVTSLKLSNNGRAIADNAAVFLAGFEDGSTGLVRVDL